MYAPSVYVPVMLAPAPYAPFLPVGPMPRTDLPAHLITLGNEQSPVCRHFLDGRCERGSACKFSHDVTRGAPTERHRLVDTVRLLSVYALESILRGREALGDTLRDDCADRYIVKVNPAPCVPHPTIVNQRVKMYELHVQERRGYSVRNPRPRKALEEVLAAWDTLLAGDRYSALPKALSFDGIKVTDAAMEPFLVGRSPSYGSVKLSLRAWAHLSTVYMCECFLDLMRRELLRGHFFEDGEKTAASQFEAFSRAAAVVLEEHMLPNRYAEHATTKAHRRVCHHPETFLDVLRLAFPQLLVCRTFSVSPTRGAEVKLIAAGKSAQLEAFFDRVAEYVWVVEKRGVQARVHGLRSDSDALFDKKVRQHWTASITSTDGMNTALKQQVHAFWRHILFTQYTAFTAGLADAKGDEVEPTPTSSPHLAHGRHPRRGDDGPLAAQHLAARSHHHGAGLWEEWHAADANREANPEDNPPDGKGGKTSSGEESEAIERQREQLLELMDDSDY